MIDVGSGDGVKAGDAGIDGQGLVGRISEAGGSTSKVTLISDHSTAVGIRVVPAGVQALIKPTVGEPNKLVLSFINSDKHVHEGESVVTAGWSSEGIGSRFPPNIPVGEITKASVFEQEAQERAVVRPYAELRNLNLVQVLTGGER
jgi:rod shape-determining protein MreC